MRTISAAHIEELLSMPAAIRVVAEAFAAISAGKGVYPQRVHLPIEHGDALVMPGYDGRTYLGTKIVTVHASGAEHPGTTACYLLLDARDTQPLMLCDGTALTALRTGAASGLATQWLARPESKTMALFGVGRQAAQQLAAVLAVRPIDDVRVVSRDPARAAAFIARMRALYIGTEFRCCDARAAVAGADIIVTATNSTTPVLDGQWVEPGTHVNAIGSFRPQMRELDRVLLGRARIVVDQRAAAVAESGELIDAIASGVCGESDLLEIGRVGDSARASRDEITVFKTVGHAALDLFTAVALLEASER
ncbi:MAG: ornithine cyclodeaminase family protein [Betaproteobacteria bacterium]